MQMIFTHKSWCARLWRNAEPGTLHAFPFNVNISSSSSQIVQRKPPLLLRGASLRIERRQASRYSANDTIVGDPRIQELEEMGFSLQRGIEQIRQAVYRAQDGALVRQMVRSHSGILDERDQWGSC
ncbi:hypothetical protein H2248_001818 [Termitomyces sp. 'cryptogamus']|nr:hypothetical protein H2248_001818 [Termitomyces sp. 'cryptogamus']